MNIEPSKSTLGIIVPCLIFGAVGFFCFIVFCFVHKLFKDIYSPRRLLTHGRPPKISRGTFKWIEVVYNTNEDFLVNSIGLDAVMMLRFFKLGIRFFTLLSVLGLFILCPIYYYSDEPPVANLPWGYDLEELVIKAMSIENVPNQSGYLKIILLFTWIFSLLAYSFLIAFYRNYIQLKLQHDEFALTASKQSTTDMRTIMIFGVPRDLRSEMELAKYFEGLHIGKIDTIVVCRNWTRLQKAVKKRSYYLQKLEYLTAKFGNQRQSNTPYIAHGTDAELMVSEIKFRFRDMSAEDRPSHRQGAFGFFGKAVDSVDFYCKEFERFDKMVNILRKDPENSEATSVAFVTFEKAASAVILINQTIASQSVLHTDPLAFMARMAPEPRDIYWPNISGKSAHSYSKFFRNIIANIGIFFMTLSSTVVVYWIASLINLEQLAKIFPWFGKVIEKVPKTVIQLIQGVIPTVLLAIWNASSPSFLLLLCHFQGLEAESWIQQALLKKYFFYLIWNVVFVIPLSSTVVYTVIFNPQEIIATLGQMLPKSSKTMINYIILQGFAIYPAQLLLAGPLILNWFFRKFRITPRQLSDSYYPSILTFIHYGVIYPIPILMFCIGIMYSTISPLILPFCAAFFASGYFYIFMYVHVPSYESKGASTPMVVNRCLVGVFIMQLTMMGVLTLKAVESKNSHFAFYTEKGWSEYAKMVVGTAPLLFLTYSIYDILRKAYEKQIKNVPFEVLGRAHEKLMMNNDSDIVEEGEFLSTLNQKKSYQEAVPFDTTILVEGGESSTNTANIILKRPLIHQPRPRTTSTSNIHPTNLSYRERNLLDPTPTSASPFQEQFDNNEEPTRDYFLLEQDDLSLLQNAEPPMTKVSGILDPPITSSSKDEYLNPKTDVQLYSYLHPCLIGKLPVAWLEFEPFENLRKEQYQHQLLLLKRYTYNQLEEGSAPLVDVKVGRVKRFMDSFTSYIHYTLS